MCHRPPVVVIVSLTHHLEITEKFQNETETIERDILIFIYIYTGNLCFNVSYGATAKMKEEKPHSNVEDKPLSCYLCKYI